MRQMRNVQVWKRRQIWGNLKGREHLEDLGADEKIILKRILM
jgi:hypothetical protein